MPARDDVDGRVSETVSTWQRWSAGLTATGPWKDAVERSALTLKLLLSAASGAVAAASTTSLPETIGGERNWDYRYCWIRDSAFTLDALLHLGCAPEANAFFWWLMHASQLTHPRLRVLYRMDGGPDAKERLLNLGGYRGSTPVRIGNGAVDQLQLDIYGDLLQAAWTLRRGGVCHSTSMSGDASRGPPIRCVPCGASRMRGSGRCAANLATSATPR